MKEERIPEYYARRKRKYTGYKGEITPAPADRVKRKFRAAAPNQLWLTDVSEFAGPDGKVYLSPMIDCFDGKVVAWKALRSPSKALTQGMLADAIGMLPAGLPIENSCVLVQTWRLWRYIATGEVIIVGLIGLK